MTTSQDARERGYKREEEKTTDEPDETNGRATRRGRRHGGDHRGSRVLLARWAEGLIDEVSPLLLVTFFWTPKTGITARNGTSSRQFPPESAAGTRRWDTRKADYLKKTAPGTSPRA